MLSEGSQASFGFKSVELKVNAPVLRGRLDLLEPEDGDVRDSCRESCNVSL